jgi:hypothetical protein
MDDERDILAVCSALESVQFEMAIWTREGQAYQAVARLEVL